VKLRRRWYRTIQRWWPAVLAMVLLGTACSTGNDTGDTDRAAAGPAAMRDLSSIDELREQFNRDQGVTRLILLISPT
jgi:hypothetical protein